MRQNKLARVLKLLGLLPLTFLVSACQGVALLDPKGPIGAQERDLIYLSVGLGLIILIPVFFMVAWFAFRYRESNTKATYKPHWEGTVSIEVVLWLVPLLIIGVLSYLTWVKTTELDPYRPIPSTERPLHVQVVSLDWNWLFIYPDYNIATMNKLVIPAGVPVTFDMTSATVMTSFFIPDLGSQMYVMAGMVSHLNLLADKPGTFTGHNMEFSGIGYETMHFTTSAVTKDQFASWTNDAKGNGALSLDQFNKLNKPQPGLPETTYASVEPNLFLHIVGEFMDTRGMVKAGTTADSMKMTKE
jgi:cytochrome o ubiquinol oxidase subunit 2